MKNKKIIVILVGVIVIIVGSFMIFSKDYETIEKMTEIVNNDWNNKITDQKQPAFLTTLNSLSSYEIIDIKKEKGNYIIDVKINGVDLATTLSNISVNDLIATNNEDEINKYLINLIEQSEQVETKTIIYVEQLESEYKIYYSDEFVDAMTGKVYTYSQDLMNQIIEEVTQ